MILLRTLDETTSNARHVRAGDFVLLAKRGAASPTWYTVVTAGDIDGFTSLQLFDPDTGELTERGFRWDADVTRRTTTFERGETC